jgi:hypothetical protein
MNIDVLVERLLATLPIKLDPDDIEISAFRVELAKIVDEASAKEIDGDTPQTDLAEARRDLQILRTAYAELREAQSRLLGERNDLQRKLDAAQRS